ncbi:I78 family peptidase inhibitor [Lysobacter korlensis]|uniref:I78 family peptidase inhibitor n=1 Tax=Lysobacter korlensis TaxID=553636 RepID=A0ABV6RI13_9GAMM
MIERRRAERRPSRLERQGLAVPLLVLILSVGACATMGPPPAPAAPTAGANMCNAEAVRWAIGREPTQDVVERARIESGSSAVRVIRPGDVVTMDHRTDRLNLDVNASNAITGARCG